MQRWEYYRLRFRWEMGIFAGHYVLEFKDRTLKDEEIWDYLNQLGKRGWELVSVIKDDSASYMLWFKRPISE